MKRPTLPARLAGIALLLPLAAAAQAAAPPSAQPAAQPAAQPTPQLAALPTALPSEDWVREALERHPAVQQARQERLAAQQAAGMLATSPHEWTVDAGLQQRRANSGARGNEWSLGLQRTWRLPGKADLDQRLGDAGLREAAAREAAAWQGAARELLDRWIDGLAARSQRTLQERQLALARQSQDAVQRRHRAGDAAQLDVQATLADVADVERQLAVAQAAEARALRRLQQFAPGQAGATATASASANAAATATAAPAGEAPLPDPTPPAGSASTWRQRVLACDAELSAARATADLADLLARRVEAERRPDPTVGVRSAAEAYRSERVIGLTLSIPLGGSYREQAAREAWHRAQASRAALDVRQREAELAAQELIAEAEDGVQRWQLADRAARAGAESARLLQRAHALGEADLQPSLQARRLAIDAQRSALEARLTAWRAQWRLQVDAGDLWPRPGAGCAAPVVSGRE